jgi:hypothetical protein
MPVMLGRKRLVKDVVNAAIVAGCEVRTSTLQLVTEDGLISIRFLFNPKTGGRVPITDYRDDEYMVESVWQALERRLDITLPTHC